MRSVEFMVKGVEPVVATYKHGLVERKAFEYATIEVEYAFKGKGYSLYANDILILSDGKRYLVDCVNEDGSVFIKILVDKDSKHGHILMGKSQSLIGYGRVCGTAIIDES